MSLTVRRPFLRPTHRSHVVLILLAILLLAVPFTLLVVLVREKGDWVQTLDHRTAARLHSFGADHPGFVSGMRVVSDVGSPAVWWLVILLASALLVRLGARKSAVYGLVTFAGSWLLNRLVKDVINRDRPHLAHPFAAAHGASFPSGHAQAATVACGVLLVVGWPFLSKRRAVLCIVGAAAVVIAVCFSRVALGVHFVSDVVAAVVLGLAWLLLMTAALTVWQQHDAAGAHPQSGRRLARNR